MITRSSTLRRFLATACLASVGCTQEVDTDKPCRLTKDGWVCQDAGFRADTGAEIDQGVDAPSDTNPETPDTAQPIEDVGQAEDQGGTPDVRVEPMPDPKTCVEARNRGAASGKLTLDIGGRAVEVFCDMDTEGGGWMLIGRSSPNGASTSFGWRSKSGSIDDAASPYSLGEAGFAFNEMLLGNMAGPTTLGDRVYRIGAPDDFWNACVSAPCAVTVSAARGMCTNSSMFNNVGFNNSNDRFWFRDVPEDVTYGLTPGGFNTYYTDCIGGEVHAQQGMLFIR